MGFSFPAGWVPAGQYTTAGGKKKALFFDCGAGFLLE